MTNRLNELNKNLPISKNAIDELINCIASCNGIDDNILSTTLNKLKLKIRKGQD